MLSQRYVLSPYKREKVELGLFVMLPFMSFMGKVKLEDLLRFFLDHVYIEWY